jgi:hypothetical protein
VSVVCHNTQADIADVPSFDLEAGQTPRSPVTPISQNGR